MSRNRRPSPAASIAAVLTIMLSALVFSGGPAAASDDESLPTDDHGYAPVDQPGPALSVPEVTLARSVVCSENAKQSGKDVTLFVHGTTMTPGENFEWNWLRAMTDGDRPFCTVALPNRAMSDAQVSAEYVVHAVRDIHRTSGRKVNILGHSQGGLVPRFALRFWPDIRAMVDDYVGFGATNHGSYMVNALCPPGAGCSPSLWQQTADSAFTRATNSRQETFAGISYTNIYTRTDEFVRPALDDTGTSSLHTGDGRITNVAIQDVCPLDVASEHIAVGSYDPVAYALAIDALDHDGPADPDRIARSVCSEPLMPGVETLQFATGYVNSMTAIAKELVLHDRTPSEPKLKPYVFAK